MDIFIARHGPNNLGGSEHLDRERALTPRGIKHVAAVAARMRSDGQRPFGILASTYKRTVQTADIFGRAFNVRVSPVDELISPFPVCDVVCKLADSRWSSMMLVAHHTNIAAYLSEYGDGAAPVILSCGEVRRYDMDPVGRLTLTYRVTPADVGMPDMITLKSILGEEAR